MFFSIAITVATETHTYLSYSVSDDNELIVETKDEFSNYEQNEASTSVSHFMDVSLILLCQTSDTSTLVSMQQRALIKFSSIIKSLILNSYKLYCIKLYLQFWVTLLTALLTQHRLVIYVYVDPAFSIHSEEGALRYNTICSVSGNQLRTPTIMHLILIIARTLTRFQCH